MKHLVLRRGARLYSTSVLLGLLACACARADEALVILPPEPVLTGPHARLRLVVEEVRDGQMAGDVTSQARFSLSDPSIVHIDEQGVVTPKSDGTVELKAQWGERTAATKIVVKSSQSPEPWSFRNDVQTVLTRSGCNTGACHGAQAGKKGFKLALRGYDHEMDFHTLTRQAKGRRIVPSAPERSLILLKATGAIPHGGGARFDAESLEYRIISEWIAEGANPPAPGDPVVVRLEVFPNQAALSKGQSQQMLVQATYSNGWKRDVTHWAKFSSTEAGVAVIDDEGVVQVTGQGEAAITVWFASKVALASIAVPYAQNVPEELFARSPRNNLIDELVLDKLKRLRIPPSGRANDSQFLRRAYLDSLGVLPKEEEARAFLAETAPDKRARLIERLLERPEYVDYWSYKWSDLLLVSTRKLQGPAVWAFYSWIRKAVEGNLPWNEFARQVVTARGSTLENGAANYFVLHKDPKLLNEATTVTFLGLSIGCAQCHDHPLERWTLDDYYGMANLFARVRTKDAGAAGEAIVFAVSTGDVKHPTRVQLPTPRPLDGAPLDQADPADRREHLANWLTSPDNPYFAKALVNRVWANYMGRGLVEMVDDLRATNPPSNEALLAALAEDFVKQGYDVKKLIKTITSSAAYERASAALPENAADDRFYSHFLAKRMSAEVLLDALSEVTGVPTEFPDYPRGLRAMQLPDVNVTSYFLSAFGRPAREFSCECERSNESNVTQTLHLANGATLNGKLKAPGNRLGQWLEQNASAAQIIEHIYLSALARPPTADELQRLQAALAEAVDSQPADDAARKVLTREALEDLLWAILTSKEFLFVH